MSDAATALSPNECAPILLDREADALLAVLEAALNDGVTPGIGLRVEDARTAGFKIVAERFRNQEPYNRAPRVSAVVFKPGTGGDDVSQDARSAASARAGWRVLGRDEYGDADDGPWWPLYLREGPMYAESASAAVALVRERVDESEPQWEEFVAVPFDAWEVEPR